MSDGKLSALTAATSVGATDLLYLDQAGASKNATASMMRQYVGAGLTAASVSTVSAGYAADTYLAGSAITIPTAGGWRVGTVYQCGFDMVKTAAGIAAFTVTVRMGTLGTVSDTSVYTFTYAIGTAAADTGWFEVWLGFRTVGSGTSAVVAGSCTCSHHLAATGLITTGASGTGILVPGASAGFNSTTQTIVGLSVNGGASFSGTNTLVQAFALNI